MLDNLPFSSLRLLALMSHFVLTTGLIWTRIDSIQITLKASADKLDYNSINNSYLALISFGLIFLAIEMLMFLMAPHHISLFEALKLFMDMVGCFFIAWIILDGLEWLTYVYIFVFCVAIPAVAEIARILFQLNKSIWVDWRRTRTIFQVIREVFEYVGRLFVCLIACFVAPAATEVEPSACMVGCTDYITYMRTVGISGLCASCWSVALTACTNPYSLCEGCWNALGGCASSAGACCSSFSEAIMSGPTGIMEFCTAGINSCSSDESIISRVSGCCVYSWESLSGCVSYASSSISTCYGNYAPGIYNGIIAIRDFIWSWLVWFWRQVRLFFT